MYKNVFISQPMTGKSEEEILITRQKEIEKIYQEIREMNQLDSKEDDIQVHIIDSYIDDATRKNFEEHMGDAIDGVCKAFNWDIYWLSKSLQSLAMADTIWLCNGWEYSKGCNIELECAIQYGLDIVYPEWGLGINNGE